MYQVTIFHFEVDVGKNMCRIGSECDFWISGDHRKEVVRIVNIETFSKVVTNPMKYVEYEAIKDSLCQDRDIDVFPGENRRIGNDVLTQIFWTSIALKT